MPVYVLKIFFGGDRVPYWLTINEQDVIANIPFFNWLTDINHSFQLG